MKYYLGFSIGLLYLLILSACTFNNAEEKYFEEVKQNSPVATISLADFIDKDTIYLFQASNISYSITAPKLSVREVSVLVGQTQIFSSLAMTGSFSINGAILKTGYFELKILIKSNSGTGSLADKTGLESAEIWKKWVLSIDIDPPPTPVMQISKENGFLKVSWSRYTKKNFKSYVFTKNDQGNFENVTIKNPNQTSFIDSSYLWGPSPWYSLTVNTNLHLSYNSIGISYPQLVTFGSISMDSIILIKWSKYKFESAFKNAIVMENNTVRTVITDARDTSVMLKLKEVLFGVRSKITITINAKYPGNNSSFSSSKETFVPTGTIQTNMDQNFYYNKSLEKILGYSYASQLLRIYDDSMKAVDSLVVTQNILIPYPGNYLFYPSGESIAQYNFLTKQTKSYLTNTMPGPFVHLGLFSASSNGFISYRKYYYTDSFQIREKWIVADIINNDIISQNDISSDRSALQAIISNDGKYIKMGEASVKTLANPNVGFFLPWSGFYFRPDYNDEMLDNKTPTTIISSKDGSTLRTISPPKSGYYLINYDPATKMLFYKSDDPSATSIYLVNIENQQITQIDKVSSLSCRLFMKGTLFDNFGHSKKIL